jgi:phosphoglycerate dehydrogenase-like enzyme
MSKEILIMSGKFRDKIDRIEEFLDAQGCTLASLPYDLPMTEDQLCEAVQGIGGLITGLERITPRVIDHAADLKVISAGGVGFDHIDLDAATARGIAVCNCAGCNNRSVAELVFGMMIGLSREIYPADREMRASQWSRYMGTELWGKTLGIVGLGRVGRSVALLGKAFNMQLLATDIVWDITFADEHGISYVPLQRLLRESDYVTLHVPLTPQTLHLIDEAAIDLMKPSAYLINAARGRVVKERALVSALKENRIAGAGLDVFEVEPHPSCPYLEFDNVIMTPHIGGSTDAAFDRALHLALLNVTAVLNGREPHSQVNVLPEPASATVGA